MTTSHFFIIAAAVLAGSGMNVPPADAACINVPAGLIAWWPGEGDGRDITGNHNATLRNGVSFAAGKVGQAFSFDGVDDSMDLGSWFNFQTFTITLWVKPGSGQLAYADILDNNHTGSRSWVVQYDNVGTQWHWGLADGSSGFTFNLAANVWQYLALTRDTNGVNRLYLGGQLVGTSAGTGPITYDGSQFLRASAWGGGGRMFTGLIDELDIYNGALSSAELQAIYNADSAGKCSLFPDTDHDGMPDAWETNYASCCALNPNDASDAANDCNGNGMTNLDEFRRGLDPCDTTKPVVVSAVSTATFDTVLVTFSKELDPATANVAANYTITPALAVTSASYEGKVATLTTAAQTHGVTAYTVTVTGVTDRSGWAVPEGSNIATFFPYMMTKNGVLEFVFWGNIAGTAVEDLTNDPRYPATPDRTGAVFSFNSRDIFPTDVQENYGATMEGYLTPTESGSYDFFLRSDDASELHISTDATVANLVLQAYELGCCDVFKEPGALQTTLTPLALVAGNRYFIRLIYKEGGGVDYGQVAWRKTTDTTPAASLRPIPGKYLSAAVDLPAPAEGAYVTQTPAPNAADVFPDTAITIVHRDGKTPWTADNVTLELDGVAVASTFTKDVNEATISYQPASPFPSKTTHTIMIGHPDPAGQPTMTEWSFSVAEYRGPILDKVNGYPAFLMGAARQTDDRGGHTGAAGDLALDTGTGTGVGYVPDASFLNPAASNDTLTVAFFQRLRAVRDSSAFWANSPGSTAGTRGIQAHTPWSNNNIYFDTSGCCGPDTRINSEIQTFPEYTGNETWWQDWHHFAFVKHGGNKRIYIDGKLFLQAGGGDPLNTDFTTLVMGGGPSITENRMDGFLDDFVVYNSALTEAQALSLSGGAAPSSVPGLIAHWDFNTLSSAPPPMISATRTATGLTITFTGRLQSADSVTGPYSDVAAATSPADFQGTGPGKYYRSVK